MREKFSPKKVFSVQIVRPRSDERYTGSAYDIISAAIYASDNPLLCAFPQLA